jgi:integrase
MTFYDLRATSITWQVLAKTEAMAIAQRAGHKNLSTTPITSRRRAAPPLALRFAL